MQLFSSWTGSDFLLFYTLLLALSGVAAWWIPVHLREPGRRGESEDLESIAVLVGGRWRLADALLADLFVRGALVPAQTGTLAVVEPDLPASSGSRALLPRGGSVTLAQARSAILVHAERVEARLRRAGLLLRYDQHVRLRMLSITPFAALFVIGLYRQRAGSAVGEPTGLLVALLALTIVMAIIRYAKSDPRTAAGIAAIQDLRAQASRVARAPRPDEAALAVALFGTGVLVGTPWEPVHALHRPSGDGGGADGDSDGGGSGCGGGCGGCGG